MQVLLLKVARKPIELVIYDLRLDVKQDDEDFPTDFWNETVGFRCHASSFAAEKNIQPTWEVGDMRFRLRNFLPSKHPHGCFHPIIMVGKPPQIIHLFIGFGTIIFKKSILGVFPPLFLETSTWLAGKSPFVFIGQIHIFIHCFLLFFSSSHSLVNSGEKTHLEGPQQKIPLGPLMERVGPKAFSVSKNARSTKNTTQSKARCEFLEVWKMWCLAKNHPYINNLGFV